MMPLSVAVSFSLNRYFWHTGTRYEAVRWPNIHMTAKDNNKKEVFLKYKRLKQIIADGKNYSDFLSEQQRYNSSASRETSNIIDGLSITKDNSDQRLDRLEKVVRYVEEKRSKEVLKAAQTYSIGFLPDCSAYPERRWFYKLLNMTSGLKVVDMPNIQDFNTKRYETIWLDYMRSLNLSSYEALIGHGTSGEALLRYLESESIGSSVKKVSFVDCTDLYTAGERHGRRFHYYYIANNLRMAAVNIISTSNMFETESLSLRDNMVQYGVNCTYFPIRRDSVNDSTTIASWLR
jgi:hypothetical protein